PVAPPAWRGPPDRAATPAQRRPNPGLRRQSARPMRPSVVGRRFLLLCPVVAVVAGRGARISRAGRGAGPVWLPRRRAEHGPAPPPAVLDGGQGGPDFFRRA